MSCNLQFNDNKTLKGVFADNGNTSILYKDAVREFGTDEALSVYLTSKSDDFQETVVLLQNELDVNNEPKLKTVLSYLSLQNENKESLTIQQKLDLQNFNLGVDNFSTKKLLDAFYKEGIFNVSPQALKKSGLYSDYEIANLIQDVDLQERVKQTLEALKNTEDVELEEQTRENLEKTDEINSFGKLIVLNPYIVQKEILNKLAATTEQQFETAVSEIEYPNFQRNLNKEQLFQEMQGYKKAEVFIEVDGQVVRARNTNTNAILPLVAKQVNNVEILTDINQIQQYDLDVLNLNREDTVKILKEIEDNLIGEGIDVAGLSGKDIDGNLMVFLGSLETFINTPTRENTQTFSDIYDTFFEKDVALKTEIVKQNETDRDFVRLDTNLSEEEIYEQQGLIKVKDGLYIAVEKQDLDTLYANLETYKDKYPKNTNLREYVQTQISKLENFTSSDNAEAVFLYKTYYSQKISLVNDTYTTSTGEKFTFEIYDGINGKIENINSRQNKDKIGIIVRNDSGSQIGQIGMFKDIDGKFYANIININENFRRKGIATALYKYIEAQGIQTKDSEIQTEQGKAFKKSFKQTKNNANFTGNFEYLTTDFVSDFYIKILKEREKNSEIYKNFYSNFDVNEKGIFLVNDDPITMAQIKEYIDENLKQYSILSKQLPLLIEQEIQSETKQARRDAILNSPQNLEKYQGQFHKINDNNIILKNSEEEFIKVEGNIFEAVDTDGNLSLFSRLNSVVDNYYVFNNKEPKTDVKIEEYLYLNTQPEKFLTEKNYLSKSAKEKINEEFFDC